MTLSCIWGLNSSTENMESVHYFVIAITRGVIVTVVENINDNTSHELKSLTRLFAIYITVIQSNSSR